VLTRSLVVWCALLVMAFANGMVRVAWIIPRTGDFAGHGISSLTLSAAIVALTWATIEWLAPSSMTDALRIGALWLLLTLAFEFGAGRYVFHRPWDALLQDYNLFQGRIWMVVLLATTLAPLLAGWARGIFDGQPT
jgi:hypothetical protein